ncbi:MAG: GAF domain-containing protein [Acidobacteriota bacterium]|nr:GAF domain-containing protein [Acidobacteriota bacterium]
MSGNMESWLKNYLEGVGAVAGTVHLHHDRVLTLAAAVNIPPPVLDKVRQIPYGKGMAGMALQYNKPIQTCNLKEDESGHVKPGARAVDAKAAVAFPLHDRDGAVTAVVGIAFPDERELDDALVADFCQTARDCPV